MTTGERIRARRLQLGMTQEELGEKVGVKKAAINKYETGLVVNLKRSIIAKLAEALQLDPAALMGYDKAEEPFTRTHVSEDELKFALFGDDAQEVTDAQFEEVKRFAQFVMQRDGKK